MACTCGGSRRYVVKSRHHVEQKSVMVKICGMQKMAILRGVRTKVNYGVHKNGDTLKVYEADYASARPGLFCPLEDTDTGSMEMKS